MKILYALQGTGNGHLSRAREIIPYLLQYGETDLLVSGESHDVQIPYLIRYRRRGIGFTFGKNGSVDMIDSIKRLKPFEFLKDIYTFPVNSYDMVINDFEPITAWACKIKHKPCFSLSHQAAYLSPKTPRIAHRNKMAEIILKHYAPATYQTGFHFKPYDNFIHTPVIRSQIRKSEIDNKGHITVYLPAYADEFLLKHFNKMADVKWHLFSKHSYGSYHKNNVFVQPVNNEIFVQSLCTADGLITNGGFESPAEAMYLRKKVMVIPMWNQYEQLCNAFALKQMGVTVLNKINHDFNLQLKEWLYYAAPVKVNYTHQLPAVLAQIFQQQQHPLSIAV